MAVKSGAEWLETLRAQTPTVYMSGEKLEKVYENPTVFTMAMIFAGVRDILNGPIFREKGSVASSPLINEEVSLFANIHQRPEEWIARTRIQRDICRRSLCVFRCLQEDYQNAYWAITYETDQAHNTDYHKRLVEWVKHMQKTDGIVGAAWMDARGDRTKPPHEQPDAFMRVIEKRKDGIVVRGCKSSISLATNCNELSVTPPPLRGRYSPTAEDKDFAVAFAIPLDTEGRKLIGKVPLKREPKTSLKMDYPFSRVGFGDLVFTAIFDDVFVPWERVFLCGEWDMLERAASLTIETHFSAKGGCKAGVLDLLCGAAALAAEYNGIENTPHAKQRLIHLMSWGEEAFAAAIGAEVEGEKHPSGVWFPDPLKASANKWLCSENGPGDIDILLDLGGGIVTNAPAETEWDNPEIRGYLDKYLVGKSGFSAEERVRVMKLLEDLTATDVGGLLHQLTVNAGGDLQAARNAVYSLYDLEDRKRTARVFAGIEQTDSLGFTWVL